MNEHRAQRWAPIAKNPHCEISSNVFCYWSKGRPFVVDSSDHSLVGDQICEDYLSNLAIDNLVTENFFTFNDYLCSDRDIPQTRYGPVPIGRASMLTVIWDALMHVKHDDRYAGRFTHLLRDMQGRDFPDRLGIGYRSFEDRDGPDTETSILGNFHLIHHKHGSGQRLWPHFTLRFVTADETSVKQQIDLTCAELFKLYEFASERRQMRNAGMNGGIACVHVKK